MKPTLSPKETKLNFGEEKRRASPTFTASKIVPKLGVVPPSARLSHNSTLSALERQVL
jgi:hypothetical protein